MALKPEDKTHEKQINAGIEGRNRAHKFEKILSDKINNLDNKTFYPKSNCKHLFNGNPAINLLQYICNSLNVEIYDVRAAWLGGLATSGNGDLILDKNGEKIKKSKSDILLTITTIDKTFKVGISVKSCNKKNPTNAQMYFSTSKAFCNLLRENDIIVSENAEKGLSMFCGDTNYTPQDLMDIESLQKRKSDPRRYFWEELDADIKKEWETIFNDHQSDISLLLLQKAYKNDPYYPDFLLHQTTKYEDINNCEVAIFTMDEIVNLSCAYNKFHLTPYVIRKGTYKNDPNTHLAPKFGFIQFQRGGQKQHPTQLQFNLKAGYFNQ